MNIYEVSTELDSKTLAKAKKELNENSKQRVIDVESTKEWILKQAFMNSKLDDDFIISFLRTAKYSYSRTQELIRNYWVNRTEMTDMFHGRNYDDDSVLMEIADTGLYFPLPKPDNDGRIVLIQRIGAWDVEKFEFFDVAKYMFSVLDIVCQDPRAQINGVSILMDATGFTAKHASTMSPARAQRLTKCLQDMYPVRIKGINYYNTPKIFEAVFSIVKVFLKDKIKNRIKFHGSEIKSVHKEIPKSILPKEYGGEGESIEKLNQAWVNHLKSQQNLLLDLQKYGVDLSKVPNLKSTVATSAASGDTSGLTGTFRKLNVD